MDIFWTYNKLIKAGGQEYASFFSSLVMCGCTQSKSSLHKNPAAQEVNEAHQTRLLVHTQSWSSSEHWLNEHKSNEQRASLAATIVDTHLTSVSFSRCIAEDAVELGPMTFFVPQHCVLVHVWQSRKDGKRAQEAFRRASQRVFELLITGLHVPLSSLVMHQGMLVSVVWIPALASEKAVSPEPNTLLEANLSLLQSSLFLKQPPLVHMGQDGRCYLVNIKELAPTIGETKLSGLNQVPRLETLDLLIKKNGSMQEFSRIGFKVEDKAFGQCLHQMYELWKKQGQQCNMLFEEGRMSSILHQAGIKLHTIGVMFPKMQSHPKAHVLVPLFHSEVILRSFAVFLEGAMASLTIPSYAPHEMMIDERIAILTKYIQKFKTSSSFFQEIVLIARAKYGLPDDYQIDRKDMLLSVLFKRLGKRLGIDFAAEKSTDIEDFSAPFGKNATILCPPQVVEALMGRQNNAVRKSELGDIIAKLDDARGHRLVFLLTRYLWISFLADHITHLQLWRVAHDRVLTGEFTPERGHSHGQRLMLLGTLFRCLPREGCEDNDAAILLIKAFDAYGKNVRHSQQGSYASNAAFCVSMSTTCTQQLTPPQTETAWKLLQRTAMEFDRQGVMVGLPLRAELVMLGYENFSKASQSFSLPMLDALQACCVYTGERSAKALLAALLAFLDGGEAPAEEAAANSDDDEDDGETIDRSSQAPSAGVSPRKADGEQILEISPGALSVQLPVWATTNQGGEYSEPPEGQSGWTLEATQRSQAPPPLSPSRRVQDNCDLGEQSMTRSQGEAIHSAVSPQDSRTDGDTLFSGTRRKGSVVSGVSRVVSLKNDGAETSGNESLRSNRAEKKKKKFSKTKKRIRLQRLRAFSPDALLECPEILPMLHQMVPVFRQGFVKEKKYLPYSALICGCLALLLRGRDVHADAKLIAGKKWVDEDLSSAMTTDATTSGIINTLSVLMEDGFWREGFLMYKLLLPWLKSPEVEHWRHHYKAVEDLIRRANTAAKVLTRLLTSPLKFRQDLAMRREGFSRTLIQLKEEKAWIALQLIDEKGKDDAVILFAQRDFVQDHLEATGEIIRGEARVRAAVCLRCVEGHERIPRDDIVLDEVAERNSLRKMEFAEKSMASLAKPLRDVGAREQNERQAVERLRELEMTRLSLNSLEAEYRVLLKSMERDSRVRIEEQILKKIKTQRLNKLEEVEKARRWELANRAIQLGWLLVMEGREMHKRSYFLELEATTMFQIAQRENESISKIDVSMLESRSARVQFEKQEKSARTLLLQNEEELVLDLAQIFHIGCLSIEHEIQEEKARKTLEYARKDQIATGKRVHELQLLELQRRINDVERLWWTEWRNLRNHCDHEKVILRRAEEDFAPHVSLTGSGKQHGVSFTFSEPMASGPASSFLMKSALDTYSPHAVSITSTSRGAGENIHDQEAKKVTPLSFSALAPADVDRPNKSLLSSAAVSSSTGSHHIPSWILPPRLATEEEGEAESLLSSPSASKASPAPSLSEKLHSIKNHTEMLHRLAGSIKKWASDTESALKSRTDSPQRLKNSNEMSPAEAPHALTPQLGRGSLPSSENKTTAKLMPIPQSDTAPQRDNMITMESKNSSAQSTASSVGRHKLVPLPGKVEMKRGTISKKTKQHEDQQRAAAVVVRASIGELSRLQQLQLEVEAARKKVHLKKRK